MRRNYHIESSNNIISDINLTNLIDVILVILIIYILITPLLNQGIELTLPKSSMSKIENPSPIIVTISKKGIIFLNDIKVKMDNILDIIQSKTPDLNKSIIIKADKDISYGKIIQLLDILNSAGYENVGLATKQKN